MAKAPKNNLWKVIKKRPLSQETWVKTPEYREAVLLKVLRSMKSYGYEPWMTDALKELGLSI